MTDVALLLLALMDVRQIAASETELRIGVAAGKSSEYCLALPGPALAEGSPVTLVTVDGDRQQFYRLVIARTVSACPAMANQASSERYYLLASGTASELPNEYGLGVAVPGRPGVRVVGSEIRLRLSDRLPEARVRSCSSREGLHLTMWSGTPLRTRRLWHAYWYLGYDVEPDCQPADWQ